MYAHEYDDNDTSSVEPGFTVEFDDDELDVESMERVHEAVEVDRAALLGSGVLKAAAPNAQITQSLLAQELQSTITAIRYKSELKDISRQLSMGLSRKQITNAEYDALEKEFSAKKAMFERSKVPSPKVWKPSDVLDTMPKSRIRSAGERAGNDRHDLDD